MLVHQRFRKVRKKPRQRPPSEKCNQRFQKKIMYFLSYLSLEATDGHQDHFARHLSTATGVLVGKRSPASGSKQNVNVRCFAWNWEQRARVFCQMKCPTAVIYLSNVAAQICTAATALLFGHEVKPQKEKGAISCCPAFVWSCHVVCENQTPKFCDHQSVGLNN